MNLKSNVFIAMTVFFFVLNGYLFAQKKADFKDLSTTEGVKLSYKWAPNKKSKTPALELWLKLENTNNYCTDVTLNFALFLDHKQKSKSDEIKKCIKPHKKIKGKKKGMSYLIEEVTMDDVNSNKLEIQITEMEVQKVAKCKKK
ncbi:MAG: hypothetical protein HY958_13475 [Bacteroidia bacterium]|nr:hypothetical protein [Bacteroidia bacterium]